MTKSIRTFLGLFFLLFTIYCFAETPQQNPATTNILEQIDQIARKSNVIIGVTAIHIENNEQISYNGEMPFFMASTIKVPIALALLQRVDQKQESLERLVHLTADNSIPGSGRLDYILNRRPLDVSIKRLLNLMLMVSDNTASDAILQQVNGPNAVSAMLNHYGFNSILIKRSIMQMYMDAHGADYSLLQQPHTSISLEKSLNEIPVPKQIYAWKVFQDDVRDTTTPDDMALLLAALFKGQLLSSESTQFLLHLMQQCKTGGSRIRGLLPSRTIVAHKTGTWSIYSRAFLTNPESKQLYRFVSDVGVVTLPDNKGHVAIAVYVKSTATSDYGRSHVIAEVSKKIFDYFAYDGNPPPEKKIFKFRKKHKQKHKH